MNKKSCKPTTHLSGQNKIKSIYNLQKTFFPFIFFFADFVLFLRQTFNNCWPGQIDTLQ